MKRLTVALLLCLASWRPARAGGGPETTLVVVNAASPVSRRVANEYVALRAIPPEHVVRLEGIPHLGVVSMAWFLDHVWSRIDAHLKRYGLEGHIDLIAYSADLPYAVDIREQVAGFRGQPHPGRQASWTGLTYLIRHVLEADDFYSLAINKYYRLVPPRHASKRRATPEESRIAVRAFNALNRGRNAEAARSYAKLLETYKDDGRAYYNYACALARLGRKREALAALEGAYDTGLRNADHAANDPDLAPLRGEAGFRELLERMRRGVFSLRPSRGFRSSYGWTDGDEPLPVGAGPDRYYLAVRLGYTGPYGNTLPEVLECLRRGAASDGTRPDGTVYLCRNQNVRSTAREPFFATVVEELRKRGRKVEILARDKHRQTGVLPVDKPDVIGAVVGSAGFSWAKSRSRLLPGAIAEHLTSFGAHFGTPGQTKLSEFIRFGAAGSSGTVTEPYALHQKFPNPAIHVYYADGCSLAEAFYQSIRGPYQLMVVGDGLARPFATFVDVKATLPPQPWTGTVGLSARAAGAGTIELWVDGRFVATGAPGAPLALDTATLDDGYHDVRLVAVADDPVETRSYERLEARVDNFGLKASVHPDDPRPWFGRMHGVRIRAEGAREFQLLCGTQVVATADDGKLAFDTAGLGPGTVTLVPRAVFADGHAWRGRPLPFEIDDLNPIAAAKTPPPARTRPGLYGSVTAEDGTRSPVAVTHLGDARSGRPLRDQLPAKGVKSLELTGWFDAPADGFYEFALTGSGRVELTCISTMRVELGEAQAYHAVALRKGVFPLTLRYEPKGRPDLELMLGGARVFGPVSFRHAAGEPVTKAPSVPEPFAPLVDGTRDGGKAVLTDKGALFAWKRTEKNLAAVTLYFEAKSAGDVPQEWVVEVSKGYGKLKPVEELRTVKAVRAKPPAKDQPDPPAFVELSFKPTRCRKLRLAPRSGTVQLTEVEFDRRR